MSTENVIEPDRHAETVRVYICVDDEAGPENASDVTPGLAAALVVRGLCYEPEDDRGSLWTYIGKGQATWDYLQQFDGDVAQEKGGMT